MSTLSQGNFMKKILIVLLALGTVSAHALDYPTLEGNPPFKAHKRNSMNQMEADKICMVMNANNSAGASAFETEKLTVQTYQEKFPGNVYRDGKSYVVITMGRIIVNNNTYKVPEDASVAKLDLLVEHDWKNRLDSSIRVFKSVTCK